MAITPTTFAHPSMSSGSSLTPRWSQRRLPLEFSRGAFTGHLQCLREVAAGRRGSALDR